MDDVIRSGKMCPDGHLLEFLDTEIVDVPQDESSSVCDVEQSSSARSVVWRSTSIVFFCIRPNDKINKISKCKYLERVDAQQSVKQSCSRPCGPSYPVSGHESMYRSRGISAARRVRSYPNLWYSILQFAFTRVQHPPDHAHYKIRHVFYSSPFHLHNWRQSFAPIPNPADIKLHKMQRHRPIALIK